MPKLLYIFLGITALALLIFSIFAISYKSAINQPAGKDLLLEIPAGTSRLEFSQVLSEQLNFGSIKKTYLRIFIYSNKDLPFEAGVYGFNSSDSVKYIFQNLRGGSEQVSVTFLEGWRVEENTIELLKKVGKDYAQEYFDAAKNFQGTLFPDTYFIDPTKSAAELVKVQQQNFEDKTSDLFFRYNDDLSREEVINIASIVQRESLPNDDINVIAGVLIKRYKNGMPLDADATTQYAVGNNQSFDNCLSSTSNDCDLNFWPSTLTTQDLESKDPYNTRGQLGLPPSPISNPSLESIRAVIEPEDTAYFYYLHDTNGNTYFARTLDEHIENIQNYL